MAGGKLFNTIFGLDYMTSLFITAGVVIFYTFLGGFLAVSWTDCIQGMMMFFAILLVPVTAAMYLGGPVETAQLIATEFPAGLSIWGPEQDTFTLAVGIISSLGWGAWLLWSTSYLSAFHGDFRCERVEKSYEHCHDLGSHLLVGCSGSRSCW